jgi:flagellar biosynthesis GTPase FlhF
MQGLPGAQDTNEVLREKLRIAEERADSEANMKDLETKRADRETKRADSETKKKELAEERADSETKRADSETKRADSEANKKELAEEKAKSEAEKKELAEERADSEANNVKLLNGTRWVCFSDLATNLEDISDSTSLCLGDGFAHPYIEFLRPTYGDKKLVNVLKAFLQQMFSERIGQASISWRIVFRIHGTCLRYGTLLFNQ